MEREPQVWHAWELKEQERVLCIISVRLNTSERVVATGPCQCMFDLYSAG